MGFTYDFHPGTFLFVYIVICLICYFTVYKKKYRDSNKNLAAMLALILYILLLLKYVILPIETVEGGLNLNSSLYYQIIPLKSILEEIEFGTWKIQLIGNILLLVPFVFFMNFYKDGNLSFKTIITKALFFSLSIEIIQILIDLITKVPNKVADIDDILLNLFGVTISWFFLRIMENTDNLTKHFLHSRKSGTK